MTVVFACKPIHFEDDLFRATQLDHRLSEELVQEYVYNPRLLEIVARRPTYVGLALWLLHHPAWVEGHTGGSRFTPTVHPC